ncbi:MAG: hypothetical protein AAFZ87_18270 [Planctomycetota bacterium]
MKGLVTTAALAATTLAATSCNSGPKQLSRTWDTKVNQWYAEDSWIHGALLQDILPVYPIVGFVATIGDALILNPIQFWGTDVWDRKGTAYEYAQPTGAERTVTGWKPTWMEGE